MIQLKVWFERISIDSNADASASVTWSRSCHITNSQCWIMFSNWIALYIIGRMICCHAIVIRIFFVSEGLNEVLAESCDMGVLLLELVNRDGVGNGLDEAACWTSGYNVEGFEPKLKLMSFENCLEFLD